MSEEKYHVPDDAPQGNVSLATAPPPQDPAQGQASYPNQPAYPQPPPTGQPPFSQPPPPLGQPPAYSQPPPAYSQPPPGQPSAYLQPPTGPPSYTQPPAGQPQYPQPPYPQPASGQAASQGIGAQGFLPMDPQSKTNPPGPAQGYAYSSHPAPATGGYPVGQAANTTVIINQPGGAVLGNTVRYRRTPALIICQHCNATVTTTVDDETSTLQWIVCFFMCLFGCFFLCCLIPFCITDLKDARHSCPNCKQVVGKFSQVG
ncbi:lipopolysaccharide-induced tumor necrosis factor-alpha factor homolog [Haliotis asinina]|uniref:lipopolysaccharide-induced tumor necrosis factor-alpha factor homolog n=1 Tax=Haliotis asinina TaxID=109174 RepID=UPI0035318D68